MKKLISLFLSLALCLSLASGVTAFADGAPGDGQPGVSASGEPVRAEETEWYSRITDEGWIQIRLWSITYGYWKTDWITIGHV